MTERNDRDDGEGHEHCREGKPYAAEEAADNDPPHSVAPSSDAAASPMGIG
jgi:hypothetical protein